MIVDIFKIKYSEWKAIFQAHLDWCRQEPMQRMSGAPSWDEAGLNVLAVRMNPITDFYERGKSDFNDYLVMCWRDTQGEHVRVIPCTTDPAHTHENPKGVAHLAEGCWDSYARGTHKAPWRTALVQSKGPVVVYRTDHQGKILCSERGYFGINVHNAAGFGKPSAGCTVLMPAGRVLGMGDKNFAEYKAILKAAPDRRSRTYTLMSHKQIARYGFPLVQDNSPRVTS